MIQGIQSNTISVLSSLNVDSVKKASSTNTEQEITSSQVSKTDTVEISAEGRIASEAAAQYNSSDMQSFSDETESETESELLNETSEVSSSSVDKPKGPPPPPPPSTTTESEETEELETTSLTTLTESQLDSLVADGTITQAEKNTELARRESTEAEDDTNSGMSIADIIELDSLYS
jgi:hypothetical protein